MSEMLEILKYTLALLFVAWVIVESEAIQHWWRLFTRKETPREFWAALIGCRMCTGFWVSVFAAPFLPLDVWEIASLNGVHYVLLTLEGALWRAPDEPDTSSMAAPAWVEEIEGIDGTPAED